MNNKNNRKKVKGKNKTKNMQKQIYEKLKENRNALLVCALIIFIIIFCIYKVVVFIQNPTNTFTLEQGKIYQEEKTTGYIIRDETIVKGSNYKNGMEQIKSEGERVAKNEAIFRYYSTGEESLVNKIKDLDQKIDETISNETNLFTSDTKALEKQIENSIFSLRKENSIQTITKIKKDISNSIVKKAKITGEYSPAGSYLKKLINERSQYENKLNKGAEYLKAPISGLVSYKVDGYEDVLTPKDFTSITTEFLEGLNLKTGQIVADSKESAKIINNFKSYIACSVKSEQAQNAQLQDIVKLRFTNNIEVMGEIKYIKQENDGKTVIVFEIDKQLQELISFRKISFDIIWWSNSGKKIPNEAIGYEQRGENQIAYVTKVREQYRDKVWIKILRQNEKYAIVNNYTDTELKDLGFTDEETKGRQTLTLYDEILKKSI